MKILAFAATSLVLCAATASASTTVPRVEATADPLAKESILVACSNPRFSDTDLTTVLGTTNHYQLGYLRTGMTRAVTEACDQNIASIVVQRRGVNLDWRPALDSDTAVAIALR